MKILLAEDDKKLGKMLTLLLRKQNIVVDWLENGRAAYEKIYSDGYDVIVLDWMMPDLNGLELCRRLREEEYDGKILILTARDAVEDRVNGLNSGADDYLVKPFDITELTARLHALSRRSRQYSGEKLAFKGYTLERGTYNLVYAKERSELRPREFKLLELLMRNRGQVIPRDVLLERVWGIDSDVTENNLDVHIRMLRKKISSLGGPEIIRTVRGVGYSVE